MFAHILKFGNEKMDTLLTPVAKYVSTRLGTSEASAKLGLGLVGVSTAGVLLYRCYGGTTYNLPPGPSPLPVIGNFHNMGQNPCPHINFDDLMKKYGDIYTIYLGSRRLVVLNTPELVREAFMRQGLATARRPFLAMIDAISGNGHDIIASCELGPIQKTQRKLAHSALRKFSCDDSFENYIENAFDIIVAELEENPEFIGVEMSLILVYNILASIAFGRKFAKDDPFIVEMIERAKQFDELVEDPGFGDFIPILRFLPSIGITMVKEYMNIVEKYLVEAVEQHEQSFDPGKLTDFTYHLLNARREAHEDVNERSNLKLLNRQHYVMILSDLFLAGVETTRLTMNWIWHYLAAFPEVQKKAQQEVDGVLGKQGKVTNESRLHLPYIDAVIHEVMRIKAVVPNGVFHETSQDIMLDGHDIPKKTMLMSNTWSIHLDERNWKNADSFLPERWLDDNGQFQFQQNGFLPFSVGRRSCVGEAFAKLEIHMLTTMMLQRFTLMPLPGRRISLETMKSMSVQPIEQAMQAVKRM